MDALNSHAIGAINGKDRNSSDRRFGGGLMGDIVNLRTVRKRARRQRDDDAAAAQRLRYGVAKAERSLSQAQEDQKRRKLDQHRLQSGEAK